MISRLANRQRSYALELRANQRENPTLGRTCLYFFSALAGWLTERATRRARRDLKEDGYAESASTSVHLTRPGCLGRVLAGPRASLVFDAGANLVQFCSTRLWHVRLIFDLHRDDVRRRRYGVAPPSS